MKKLLENHKQVWNRLHREGYSGYMNFSKARMNWVLSLLPKGFLTKEQVVLEIGCGSGNWMKKISPLVGEVHGVDFSPEAIKIAERNLGGYDNVNLYVNDGCTLGLFNDNMFDLVYSFWTFQHIPRETTRSYLRESERVLKSEGLMLFQVESYDDPAKNTGNIGYLKRGSEQIGYTLKDLSDVTRDCGLRIIYRDQEDLLKHKRVYLWSLCKKGV